MAGIPDLTRRMAMCSILGGAASVAMGYPQTEAHPRVSAVQRRPDLSFPLWTWGNPKDPAILFLHGFPQEAATFDPVARELVGMGFSVHAFNQRGYARSAIPHDGDYSFNALVDDALFVADHLGLTRFHLAGFGLGALLGWMIAANHPERVRTYMPLRYPHPAAFAWGIAENEEQRTAWRATKDQIASATPRQQASKLLAEDGKGLRAFLANSGLNERALNRYIDRLREPGLLEGALSWQPNMTVELLSQVPSVRRPTMFLWSKGPALAPAVVDRTKRYVVEAEYRVEEIQGVGHFFLENAPLSVARPMTTWLEKHRST